MTRLRSRYQQTLSMTTLITLVSSTFFSLLPVLPNSIAHAQMIPVSTVQKLAKRPQNAFNSSKSGGVRGECPVGNKSLMALVPPDDPGQTTLDRPTFWFYVPFGKTSFTPPGEVSEITVDMAKFVLLDENRKLALKQPILLPLPKTAGVVRFTLPVSEQPLVVGKDYQWFFSIVCDAKQPSTNPTVSGWLTRLQANAKPIQQPKSNAQISTTGQSVFWFDYVTQVANAQAQQPTAWSDLLKKFDLQEFAQRAIADLKSNSEK